MIKPTKTGPARLTGTARYSLVRSKVTEQTTSSGIDVRYNCPMPFGDCELDATATVPAGLPVTANTDGGNAEITGTTGAVTLSSGGGDGGVGAAFGHERENLAFSRGQVTQRVAAAGQELGDDLGVEGAAALALNTSGGNIQVTDLRSATVTATTGGGDIHADGVISSEISTTTSGGNIEATGIAAPTVTATTGGGNIEIEFASVPSDVRVDTSGGNITLVLPRGDTQYHVIPRTNGGNVSKSLPENSNSPHVITATSGGGNITILER